MKNLAGARAFFFLLDVGGPKSEKRKENSTMKKDGSVVSSKIYYKFSCLVLFFTVAAASFNGFYDKNRLLDTNEFGSTQGRIAFERMVDGTANRPFVYRQLLPYIAGFIDSHVPSHVTDKLFKTYIHHDITIGRDPYDSVVLQNRTYFLRYTLIYIMVFLFAWMAVHAMYEVAKAVGNPSPSAAIAAMGFILLMPYFMVNAGFYYDYPELFFFAVAIWMALKVDWWWLVPVAGVATLNKESFLLFVPSLYPLIRSRTTRNKALVATGVLLLVCVAVNLLLHVRYAINPGGTVEVHVMDQIENLMHPGNLFLREWTYGLLTFRGFNGVYLALTIWTFMRGWKYLSKPIQRHAQIAAAINFPAFIFLCAQGELRDLSMLYITLVLLLAANLTLWSGIKGAGRAVQQPEIQAPAL